jgi:hypothetical protein
MILDLRSFWSLLRNRHRAKPCVEREALISRRTSELLPGDQNCPAARAKFLVRGRRQAILQQAHSSDKSKIIKSRSSCNSSVGCLAVGGDCSG